MGLGEKHASWQWVWIHSGTGQGQGQAEPSGREGRATYKGYIPLPLSERCGWLLTALGTP